MEELQHIQDLCLNKMADIFSNDSKAFSQMKYFAYSKLKF